MSALAQNSRVESPLDNYRSFRTQNVSVNVKVVDRLAIYLYHFFNHSAAGSLITGSVMSGIPNEAVRTDPDTS